jgi:hypothetical protein
MVQLLLMPRCGGNQIFLQPQSMTIAALMITFQTPRSLPLDAGSLQ